MSSYKDKLQKEGGFTIIEVVLVLAIAGLIFLIVFLALPQLQRSRRDTQRRSDASRVLASLETYAQNNNGNYPTVADYSDLLDNYLTANSSVFADPQNGPYSFVVGDPSIEDSYIQLLAGETCEGSGNSRDFLVRVAVEEGGKYCQDNR